MLDQEAIDSGGFGMLDERILCGAAEGLEISDGAWIGGEDFKRAAFWDVR